MLFRVLFLVIFFAVISQRRTVVDTQWIEPDAWSRAQKNDIIETGVSCSSDDKSEFTNGKLNNRAADNAAAVIYYSKLVKFLFSRHKMTPNDNGDVYSRNIKFSFTSDQMNILENSNDLRDWDAVLSEAFPRFQTLDNISSNNWISLFFGFLSTWLSYLSSEGVFTLILILVSGCIVVTNRGNKWGMVSTILLGFFIFGFIHTYYDCNRKLEIEKLMDLMQHDEDPCELMKKSQEGGFWSFFTRRSVTKEQCIEHLKKKHKIQLPFCRPDIVLLSFLNEMLFNQVMLVVDRMMHVFENINAKYSFPEKICAFAFLGLFLPVFMKLIFKYILSPSNWYGRGSKTNNGAPPAVHDSLSGENLKTFLLSVKNATEAASNQTLKLETSGVEEIPTVKPPPRKQIAGSSKQNLPESSANVKEELKTNMQENNCSNTDEVIVEKNGNTQITEMNDNLGDQLERNYENNEKT